MSVAPLQQGTENERGKNRNSAGKKDFLEISFQGGRICCLFSNGIRGGLIRAGAVKFSSKMTLNPRRTCVFLFYFWHESETQCSLSLARR